MRMSRVESLDQEWIDLILHALDIGMSLEEIRQFLASAPQ
ncbi:anti-repressor SinI family protein [Bacillus sp. 165]|nr:anti-repressor SinI family protein [Bacillus sp. 165]MBO9128492.1 anti-repressor SinI family protein [Bacillus sp. 165]